MADGVNVNFVNKRLLRFLVCLAPTVPPLALSPSKV